MTQDHPFNSGSPVEAQILFSRVQASAALGISIRAVDYLIANGSLKTRRIGRRRLIPRVQILQAIRRDLPTIVPKRGTTATGEAPLPGGAE